MKIALVGSAPSSVTLAPFADPSWQIWGCSPGVYPFATRVDAWFELHRWEPPVIGKPQAQKPWFSPEYVVWMSMLKCPVWMYEKVPEIPMSDAYPREQMESMFGNYFMTSSLSWMAAMAIDQIIKFREEHPEHDTTEDAIGFWGVDMSAGEEYGYQRAGCQFFAQVCVNMGIQVVVPPESCLLRPMPAYGLSESSDFVIKATARQRELTARLEGVKAQIAALSGQRDYLQGAIDDMTYMVNTWHDSGPGRPFRLDVLAKSPYWAQLTLK